MSLMKTFASCGGWIAPFASLLCLASSAPAVSDQPLRLHVALSPIETAEQETELQVSLIVDGHQGEPLFLGFRYRWGPVIDVADNIHHLDVGNGSLKAPNPDERRENWRVIKLQPSSVSESVHVTYQVGLGDNPPSDADAIDVRADYLHAIGTTFLPKFCQRSSGDWDCFDDVSVTFDWSAFANRAVGPGRSSDRYIGSQEGMLDALYSAGAFDEERMRIEAARQSVTMRVISDGLEPADRRDVADLIERMVQAVHSFWRQAAPEDYIISIRRRSKSGHEDGGITGTELRNGFAVVVGGRAPMSSDITLLSVFTHEYLHRWIGTKLTVGPEYRWFGEGFTEFLTWQSLWRSGIISFDRYLAAVNEALENYHRSSFRLLSPEQIDETGSGAYRLTYWRGHLLALSWWHRMNSRAFRTGDIAADAFSAFALPFDRVLRDLVDAGQRDGALDLQRIAEIAARAGLEGVTEDVGRTVLSGEMLPTENWFGGCADLTYRTEHQLDHGFDLARTFRNDGALTDVDPDGPAAAAGLKDGDGLTQLRYRENADGTAFVSLKVKRDDAVHEATFELKQSASANRIPQFQSVERFSNEQALDCLKADAKQ